MNVGSNTNNMPVTDINPDQRYFMPVDVLTSPTMVIVSDEYGNHEDFRLPLIDCGSHMIPSKKCVDLTMIFRDIEQRLLEENSLPQELTIMAGNAHTSKVRIDQW